ncbi:hypothetical protein MC885_019261 [Smutsia gigantea]|nr:hypothetical protein MC885_019261 [Smutsia gigantea]
MQRARPALWAAALTALALLRGPPAARAGAARGRGRWCAASRATRAGPVRAAARRVRVLRVSARAGVRLLPDVRAARGPALRGLHRALRAAGRLRAYLLPASSAPGNGSESEEDHSPGSVENQALPGTHRAPDPKFHPLHAKMDVIRKGHAKDSQRYKVEYESQSTDTQNFSSESKRETEYGPCRREMEDTLNQLKFLDMLSPRGIHIPNCDKKGFYKKKQCRPSKGRKRGFCWCVDKYGQPLPGFDGKGKVDVHCYSMESNTAQLDLMLSWNLAASDPGHLALATRLRPAP